MATFNGSEGGSIPLEEAKRWTAKYRTSIKPGETEAHFFGGEIIQRLLDQDGSVGIRIYYAIDDSGKKQLLLVAVNEDGNDIVPAAGAAAKATEDEGPIIVDNSAPCPPYCSNPKL